MDNDLLTNAADRTYKTEKEAFVAGLTGSSIFKINIVSLTALTTYLLWAVIKTRSSCRRASSNSSSSRPKGKGRPEDRQEDVRWMRQLHVLLDEERSLSGLNGDFEALCAQFVVLFLPLLLVNTILADYAWLLNAALGAISGGLVFLFPSLQEQEREEAIRQAEALTPRVAGEGGSVAAEAYAEGRATVIRGQADGLRRKKGENWRIKSFDSSDEEAGEEVRAVQPDLSTAKKTLPSLQIQRVSHSAALPSSSMASPSDSPYPPESSLSASLASSRAPSPYSPVAGPSSPSIGPSTPLSPRTRSTLASEDAYGEAYDGYVVSSGSSSSQQVIGHGSKASAPSLPFRVSVESAADAAYAAANPPNTYSGPDDHSADIKGKGRSGTSLIAQLFRTASHGWKDGKDKQAEHIERMLPPHLRTRSSLDTQSSHESLTYDDILSGRTGASGEHTSADQKVAAQQDGTRHAPSLLSAAANSAYIKAARRKEFLSIYRAHMMLMTIICILAVDFKIFPREFAKCESWGTSIMDLGVGSFVFSLGIVSAGPLLPSLNSPRNRFRPPRALILKSLQKALPLFALGLVRVIMVKGVDYPEHVTEYGVHWNFFLTLAVLPVLGNLMRPLTRLARYSVIALWIGVLYQVVLWRTDLQTYVLSDPPKRHGLIEANKEGLASLVGYLAIFVIGIDLGHYLLPLDPYQAFRRRSRTRLKEKTDKLSMVLASFAVLYWSAYGALILAGQEPSRRLANLTYVIWVTAYNVSFLLGYVLIYANFLQPMKQKALVQVRDSSGFATWSRKMRAWSPSLLDDLNSHAFAVFLLANLFTGVINISMQTMYANSLVAILVLTIYVGVAAAAGPIMERLGLRLPI